MHSPPEDVDKNPLRDRMELCRMKLLDFDLDSPVILDVVELLEEVNAAQEPRVSSSDILTKLMPLLE